MNSHLRYCGFKQSFNWDTFLWTGLKVGPHQAQQLPSQLWINGGYIVGSKPCERKQAERLAQW